MMKLRVRTILKLLQETWTEWQQDKVSVLAAALAYYTIFSITPLLIIAIAIAGAVFGQEAAQTEIMAQLQNLVGNQGANAIATALDNANQPNISNIASLISVALLLFGASGVFAQLQEALNTVWNVEVKPRKGINILVRKRLLSFVVVIF